MSDDEAVAPAGGVTAGMLLRQAREASGLHPATLAANLKVPVRKLEALEEDRYDLLPDAVFVRALASSVCRTLKIDPQPVLERLPQTPQPRLAHDADGINAPFRAPGDGPRSGWLEQLSRPVALTVVALLLAAVVLIFLPVAQRDGGPAPAAGPEPVMPPGTPATVTAAPAEPRTADAAAPAPAAPAPVAPEAAPGTTPAPPAAATPSVATAVPPPAPASAAGAGTTGAPVPAASPASAAAIPASGIVVFRTSGSSWIDVTDARGNTVLRRLMEAGEAAGASGALPLTVTVGNMAATEVQVRGKPYNLGPATRDNVARFEVK